MTKTVSVPCCAAALLLVERRIVSDSISSKISDNRSHFGCSSSTGWIDFGSQDGRSASCAFSFALTFRVPSSSSKAAHASSSSTSSTSGSVTGLSFGSLEATKHRRLATLNITFAASVSSHGDWWTLGPPVMEDVVLDSMIVSRYA